MPPPSVVYHCTCISSVVDGNIPPDPSLPSSSFAFHPLHQLYFCEECDRVRCNRCVSVEVSGYYCPNCLFEVPSASVRAEKNRCARNCFQCPHCRNTLSVVSSDPPEGAEDTWNGEMQQPFFLYCNYCRWDSAEGGITFEKPTGLALQLQKLEDGYADSVEFERLKDHYEPLIRSSASMTSHMPSASLHHTALTAAASALARDIPGLRQSTRIKPNARDPNKKGMEELDTVVYKSRLEAASGMGMGSETEIEWLKNLDPKHGISFVADVEQRWLSSWMQSMKTDELRPLRIPLHSKKTKRCPECTHILIKPEQKAQSVRYKIKLMAANYLPSMEVLVPSLIPPPPTPAAQAKSKAKGEEEPKDFVLPMYAGKTYPFQMTFTNPLYEPIQVELKVVRALPRDGRGTFSVGLPLNAFPISAFAEAWEYEDDDEMFDEDDLEEMLSGVGGSSDARKKSKAMKGNVGILERKANVTRIGGDVTIGRDITGDVRFNMSVTYTYRADEPDTMDDGKNAGGNDGNGELKKFTFFTQVYLGNVIPKPDGPSVRDSISTLGSR